MDEIGLAGKKVVLGMSGGVDSSVSLMLLKNAGYDVVGVSLKYDVYKCSKRKENVCCSNESFKIASEVCRFFDCEHKIIDVAQQFNKEVIQYFTDELKKNRTPSPCVFCNPRVKFDALLKYADQINADSIATGHYAKISHEEFEGERQYLLKMAKDKVKDQTYSLSFLNKNLLGRIIFPLSDLTKDEVYDLAKTHEIFAPYKKIKQSQDFCFLALQEIDSFIRKEVNPKPGLIVDETGRELGSHDGLSHYTLGQRKKIRLSGGPYYVVGKKLPDTLVVSLDQSKAFSFKAVLKPFNLLATLKNDLYVVDVKSRSSETLCQAKIKINNDNIELLYPEPKVALVPGQVAVFYHEEICLGSGVINPK